MENAQNSDLKKLQEENAELRAELGKCHQTISVLQEQLDWFKRQIFGKKSERITGDIGNAQMEFEGFDLPKSPDKEDPLPCDRKRRKPKRNGQDAITIPKDLPVKTVILDIAEEEKFCKETGIPLVHIGNETRHQLAHEPGSYYIKETIRPKYASAQRPEAGVTTVFLPDSIIPKCRADESLLAEIVTQKFADHLPLYRISEGMKRNDIQISRKLLSQWIIRCGKALKPLHEVMVSKMLLSGNLYMDEAPAKLQAKKKCKTSYIWVIAGGLSSDPIYRVFYFTTNRGYDNVPKLLQGYNGVLHADKFGGYFRLAKKNLIIYCPCWAHIRRKFFEALSGDLAFRDWVLRKIKYLFMLEQVAWARSPEERLKIRREIEAPIIDELIEKIQKRQAEGDILPKSKLAQAIGYFCGLIPFLKNYIEHPFARLDNNVAERALRPFTIGRKNWMFFGSEDGGEAAAILISFIQTCRALGINPREYLEDIFRRIMGHSANKLDELLPDQWLQARKTEKKPTVILTRRAA